MAKILDMPKLSPTMEEGVLSAWHKNEGDEIQVDDLLAEVETDKATREFRAFDKTTLLKILVVAGTNVKLGQAVAIVGNAGEDVSELVAKSAGVSGSAPTEKHPDAEPAPKTPESNVAAPQAPAQSRPAETLPPPAVRNLKPAARPNVLDRTSREAEPDDGEPRDGARVLASPYVRKVAREMGIDLHGAQGSGPGGRIVAGDLETIKGASRAMQRTVSPITLQASRGAESARYAEPEVRPLSMMRKTIARRLTEAKQTVPHFYLTIDVDASELVLLREHINGELAGSAPKNGANGSGEAEGKPLKVSVNDLLIKACATALTRVPECTAQCTPDAILVHRRVDISVAVAIPDGLVTPVVRNADAKSVVAIAREVRDLAARARAKKLKPEEMQDGTFSISNLGMFGIDAFAAVINPPEGAILAVGQVREEPVVRDGQVAAGKKITLTLSCDHRVVDGAVGAAFLAELRGLIERPLRVLTG